MSGEANSKPLDLTKPVQTRDGRKARILCTDLACGPAGWPVIAAVEYVHHEGVGFREIVQWYNKSGLLSLKPTPSDLINIPVKKEGWINVYQTGFGAYLTGGIHSTEESAKERGRLQQHKLLRTIKIEWEE